MFTYTANHTSNSLKKANADAKGGGGNETERHRSKKGRRFFFGSASPPATISGRMGRSDTNGAMGMQLGMPTMPRSRSCQCTARIKGPNGANANGAVGESAIHDRRWWLEPEDIPSIDGPINGPEMEEAAGEAEDQQNGNINRGIIANVGIGKLGGKGRGAGKKAQQAQLGQYRNRIGNGPMMEKQQQPTTEAPKDANANTLHALLIPMLSSSVGSSSTCCSESPCSSASLAMASCLLLETVPVGVGANDDDHGHHHHLLNGKSCNNHQNGGGSNGNSNGHHFGEEEAITVPKEQWPSPEELGRSLNRLFPSLDGTSSASTRDILAHLLCLRVFITPAEILHKFLQHTMFVQHASAANFSKDSQRRLFDNVLGFCAHWARSIPYDFRTQPMRDRLLAVLALSGAQKDPAAQQLCDDLLAELRVTLGRLDRYEQAVRSLEPQMEREWERRWECPTGLMALGRPPVVVAQQMAHIELERLSMIGLDELVDTIASAHSLDQLGHRPLTGCVRHYVQWFNQLSQLVASELLRHQHKRHRAKCAEFMMEVARECLALGNFNSLAAIVAGLSAQPVARLRKTWARVEKSRLEVLQRQLDPSGNFAAYRANLKATIWAGQRPSAVGIGTPLIVPFFGLLLKDIFLLFRQCRLPGPGGHLNRMAIDEFGDLMGQLECWKEAECKFPRVGPVLQHLLLSPSCRKEVCMFLLSYGYEMPENGADRDQLRRYNQQEKQQLQQEMPMTTTTGTASSADGNKLHSREQSNGKLATGTAK